MRRIVQVFGAGLVVMLLLRKAPPMAPAPQVATQQPAAPASLVMSGSEPRSMLEPPMKAACPVRVHVYNASLINEKALRKKAFGEPIFGEGRLTWLTTSDQHGLGGMLTSTMLRNHDCLSPPERADVFVIPLVSEASRQATLEETRQVHTFMPPSEQESIRATCRRISGTDWTAALHPHLTPRTAYRHVFLHEKFFAIRGFCSGSDHGFSTAVDANPSLRNWVWTDNAIYVEEHRWRGISFAFPSAVHLRPSDLALGGTEGTATETARAHETALPLLASGQAPWAPSALTNMRREYLMMFGGSLHGHPRARQMRRFLHDKCANYSEPTCKLVYADQMPGILHRAYTAKMRSVFCLEPPGFGDERKAVADALTLGCIPVTFVRQAERSFWPHHWDSEWRAQTHVFLDFDLIEAGKLDVRQQLAAISAERVAAMRTAIGRYAWRIHYPYEQGVGPRPDGYDNVWRTIHERAARDEARAVSAEL